MNELQFIKGLLYTSIELKYQEKSILIKDVIVDTGASHTIIATEFLEKMEIPFLDHDELVKATGYGGTVCYSIRKKIDEISCGDLTINKKNYTNQRHSNDSNGASYTTYQLISCCHDRTLG